MQNFIIDGNRFGFTQGNGSFACMGSSGLLWVDLDASAGTNTKIQYVTVKNSPKFGISLPASSAPASQGNVYLYNSLITSTRNIGVYARSNDVIDYNTFEYSGVGGLQLAGPGGQLVEYNTFFQNHDEWTFNTTGGQVYEDPNADNLTVIDNYLDGNNAYCPSGGCTSSNGGCFANPPGGTGTGGFEHYGANAIFTNNEVKNHVQQCGLGNSSQGVNGLTVNGIDPNFTPY